MASSSLPALQQRPLPQSPREAFQRQREHPPGFCVAAPTALLVAAPPVGLPALGIGAHREVLELDRPKALLGQELIRIVPALGALASGRAVEPFRSMAGELARVISSPALRSPSALPPDRP